MPRAGGRLPVPRARRLLPFLPLAALLPATLLCLARPAGAQPAPPAAAAGGSLGPVLLDGEFGVEAGAGVELAWSRLSAGVRALELALVPGESDPGYRWETLSGGQRRCREVATGRFAAGSRCVELATALGASAEVAWRVTGGRRPLRLGAGFRAGDASGPYAVARWRAVPRGGGGWDLRASAGPSLLRLGFGVALTL